MYVGLFIHSFIHSYAAASLFIVSTLYFFFLFATTDFIIVSVVLYCTVHTVPAIMITAPFPPQSSSQPHGTAHRMFLERNSGQRSSSSPQSAAHVHTRLILDAISGQLMRTTWSLSGTSASRHIRHCRHRSNAPVTKNRLTQYTPRSSLESIACPVSRLIR